MRPLATFIRAATFLTAVALAPAAAAQVPAPNDETERRAQAQTLFDDAQRYLAQKEFAVACAKLEEVVKLQPGRIGALMELGECYLAWGKPASAWARFRMAAGLAGQTNDPRKADADAKVAQLDPQISRVTVIVPESLRWLGGLVVERDGVPLGAATWGAAMPVDPGVHEIAASAPGKKKWSSKVEITRPGSSVTVTVAMLEDAPREEGTTGMPTLRTAGFVVGGLGVVGVVLGSVFGVQAVEKRDESKQHCDADSCTPQGHTLQQAAFGNAAVSSASFIAGGLLLAGGITMVLWPTSKSGSQKSQSARVVATPGGISLQGSW